MLIAELDDNGDVAWLWQADPGKRPKPVQDRAACLRDVDRFMTYGAEKTAIMNWLRRQAT
ncbi:MAG: hypothetical protein FJX25_12020 [Alphaproteobacteria bacterium]|nr:hypothetical protein [Alphaproteobacteria bacterium]